MKIISAKFVNAVMLPGRTPSTELSAHVRKGVALDYATGLLRVSFTAEGRTTAIVVPAANVAYLELEAEVADVPAKK